jgi:hypothetical protein
MDKPFLPENFLLSTPTSEKLYFEVAQALPIFDSIAIFRRPRSPETGVSKT